MSIKKGWSAQERGSALPGKGNKGFGNRTGVNRISTGEQSNADEEEGREEEYCTYISGRGNDIHRGACLREKLSHIWSTGSTMEVMSSRRTMRPWTARDREERALQVMVRHLNLSCRPGIFKLQSLDLRNITGTRYYRLLQCNLGFVLK